MEEILKALVQEFYDEKLLQVKPDGWTESAFQYHNGVTTGLHVAADRIVKEFE